MYLFILPSAKEIWENTCEIQNFKFWNLYRLLVDVVAKNPHEFCWVYVHLIDNFREKSVLPCSGVLKT